MSNYRDTVREMMKELKAAKSPSVAPTPSTESPTEQNNDGTKKSRQTSTTDTTGSNPDMEEEGTSDLPVPDEEDLLDDILDLEEGGPPHVEDENNSEEPEAIKSSSTSPKIPEVKEETDVVKEDTTTPELDSSCKILKNMYIEGVPKKVD